MTYLCIIFIPPVYFLTRKKWLGFVLNAILYGIACCFVLTIALVFVAVPFWILAIGHAGFSYRKELMAVQADLIATKMAEKLKEQ